MKAFMSEFIGDDYRRLIGTAAITGAAVGMLVALATIFYCEGWKL